MKTKTDIVPQLLAEIDRMNMAHANQVASLHKQYGETIDLLHRRVERLATQLIELTGSPMIKAADERMEKIQDNEPIPLENAPYDADLQRQFLNSNG